MFSSRRRSKISIFGLTALALVALAATAAMARPGKGAEHYRANLNAVPHVPTADGNSNASGTTKLVRKGRRVSVLVKAMGLSPRLPHAMHIHGKEAAGEIASCPGADRRDDLVDDGLIETAEGLDDYGPALDLLHDARRHERGFRSSRSTASPRRARTARSRTPGGSRFRPTWRDASTSCTW